MVGGSNKVIDFFTPPELFPNSESGGVGRTAARAARPMRRLGHPLLAGSLFAPEKLSVYFDKYAGELPFRRQTPDKIKRFPTAAQAAGVGDAIVDARFCCSKKTNINCSSKPIRTGHSRNIYARFSAYVRELGVAFSPTIMRRQRHTGMATLDLGSKLARRSSKPLVLFLTSARRVGVNLMVAYKESTKRENDGGLHVGSNVVFRNHRADVVDKCVVLFGDSFSEYRGHLLTGMLAETFREIHFVWSRSIDWNYVDRVNFLTSC